MSNRRRHPRVPLFSLVEMRTDDCDEFFPEMGVNLSVGGIFVETPASYAPGTFVELRFAPDETMPLIEGVGRVAFRADAGPTGAPGVGIRFLHIVEPSLSLVHEVVRRRIARAQPEA